MSEIQCVDLKSDRKLGQFWEREFVKMAAEHGKCFTPHQWHKDGAAIAYSYLDGWNQYTLPDVTIWTSPGEHHEIKHKNPTRHRSYGLEAYRFYALLSFSEITKQVVYYTIHDHEKAGGKDITENRLCDWVTCEVTNLQNPDCEFIGPSWVNGTQQRVKIYYWKTERFYPLVTIWEVQV